MNNLFNDNRIVKLLLLFRKNRAWSVTGLAEKLEVSERTVRNDIRQLERELAGCAVALGEQGRYVLHIYDEERFRAISARLLEDENFLTSSSGRMDYMFVRLMRAGGLLLTDDLAYEMHIGRTTLVSDLKKLREKLAAYQLSIAGRTSKGLELCGLEVNIRRYIMDNNYARFYRDYPLDSEVMEIVQDAFQAAAFDRSTQEAFKQFLTVMLDRFLTGHCVVRLPDSYYTLAVRQEFAVVRQILERVQQLYQVEFPVEENLFVFLPIVGMRTPTDIHDLHNIILDKSISPLLEKIKVRIEKELEISLREGSFSQEFMYHLMFMLNRLRFHVKLQHPFLEELRNKYPLAWHMAMIAADTVRDEMGLEVTEDELGYLAAYFSVFVEEHNEKRMKIFRAAVVFGAGRVTARLVKAQLRKVFDSSTRLELFSADKANTEILDQYDIILSTVDLPCSCHRPLIHIHEIFNEQDLKHKIEKAKYWEQMEEPVWDSSSFLLPGLLDENRFCVLQGVRSYGEAVAEMAGVLQAGGLVDAGFLPRLQQREKEGSMVFDCGIAIPHTVQVLSDKLVLSIGVLAEPLCHQGRELRLIFMLALPEQLDSDDGLLLRIYDEIITITQDAELCRQIAEADSFSALLRVLYHQGASKK